MNVNPYNTTEYENKWQRRVRKSKPNSNPNKPNLKKAQMNTNSFITKDYRKKGDFAVRKNKPNSNPISKKPKMNVNLYVIEDYRKKMISQSKKTNPNKPNFTYPPGEPALRSFSEGGSLCLRCAAEGVLAMTFLGAFLQRVADRPEKNVDTMNVLAIKSYRIYLNRCLLLSNY